MHSILVSDYMNHQPLIVKQTASVREAVELMLKNNAIGLPVTDDDNNLVGYLSEQDCIPQMLNDAFHCEEPGAVSKIMSTEVLSVYPNTSIIEMAETIITSKPKNYPVIESGKLIGMISRTHVLKALLDNEDDCYLRQ